MSPYMKERLEKTAKEMGCSQSEVLRTAFIRVMGGDY